MVLFFGIFIFCSVRYISVEQKNLAEEKAFSELSDRMYKETISEDEKWSTETFTPMPGLAKLKNQNNDLYGWIKIEGTNVDYPVMFTPDNPEYYLRRDFEQNYSLSGTPFLDGESREGCGNYIIYGHNMKNTTMFGDLGNYTDKEYFRGHRYIELYTLSENSRYEIFAVFLANANGDFRYYEYTDLSDEQRFHEYVDTILIYSLYDTGTKAIVGDELITLSTCSYHANDGRLVVVGKKIK